MPGQIKRGINKGSQRLVIKAKAPCKISHDEDPEQNMQQNGPGFRAPIQLPGCHNFL